MAMLWNSCGSILGFSLLLDYRIDWPYSFVILDCTCPVLLISGGPGASLDVWCD